MPVKESIIGRTFERLKVVSRSGVKILKCGRKDAAFLCECLCGTEIIVGRNSLITGNTKSCGCLRRDYYKAGSITHGHTNTKTYIVWANMIQRCTNPKRKDFERYGGRGITVFIWVFYLVLLGCHAPITGVIKACVSTPGKRDGSFRSSAAA